MSIFPVDHCAAIQDREAMSEQNSKYIIRCSYFSLNF